MHLFHRSLHRGQGEPRPPCFPHSMNGGPPGLVPAPRVAPARAGAFERSGVDTTAQIPRFTVI
jgi:hypothetical protein